MCEWGGRTFSTSLGKEQTFENPEFIRLFINGIQWAAGQPVPSRDTEIIRITAGPKGTNLRRAARVGNKRGD